MGETRSRIVSARFVRAAFSADDFPRDGLPEVAFAGRSNVGKSSLLNRLVGSKALARVSSTPGRTRSVNYFLINGRFYFVDLPGYGYAKAGKEVRRGWVELVDGYLRQAAPRALVVQLVDAKVGATPLDREALGYLASLGARVVVVATRLDRLPRGRRAAALGAICDALALGEGAAPIPLSARTGEGLKQLWREIQAHLEASPTSTS